MNSGANIAFLGDFGPFVSNSVTGWEGGGAASFVSSIGEKMRKICNPCKYMTRLINNSGNVSGGLPLSQGENIERMRRVQ